MARIGCILLGCGFLTVVALVCDLRYRSSEHSNWESVRNRIIRDGGFSIELPKGTIITSVRFDDPSSVIEFAGNKAIIKAGYTWEHTIHIDGITKDQSAVKYTISGRKSNNWHRHHIYPANPSDPTSELILSVNGLPPEPIGSP
jgi:hypothetical protein